MVDPLQQDVLVQTLADAGCEESLVQQFLQLWQAGHLHQSICLLCQYRAGLLGQIHQDQKKLDCLDYLLYQLKGKR